MDIVLLKLESFLLLLSLLLLLLSLLLSLLLFLLRLLVKHKALQLPCYLFSLVVGTFPKYRGIRSKKYFRDHQTANKIQLVVTWKIVFSGLFSF